MSINTFIPQIWSGKLLLELRKSLVYGQSGIINRDYEGEIRTHGDTVKVHNFGPVSVIDYTKNADLSSLQTLTDDEIMLKIDQSKAFNFQIDDVDKAQQNPKIMSAVMSDAAYRLADVADRFIASQYVDAGQAIGSDASPLVPTPTNAYEKLVDMGTLLTEKNIPTQGRWVIVPPWFYALLLKDDRFVKAGTATTDSVLRNGQVGAAAGFTILQSNNVPHTSGAKYKILGGTSAAWSFADAVKGLHLYGAKVFRPDALVCMTANKS